MKRKSIIFVFWGIASLATAQNANNEILNIQKQTFEKNGILNHIDVGFTAGTTGLGFDIATPLTDWIRLRTGGVFRINSHKKATLDVEVAEGLTQEEQNSRFEKLSTIVESFMSTTPAQTVEMEGTMKMNNFKFLIDIFPFKNNRHWHATVGFFYGNSTLVNGYNTDVSANTLSAISTYNRMYSSALNGHFIDLSSLGITIGEQIENKIVNKLCSWGEITDADGNTAYSAYGLSIPMGTYAHDITAAQDIYNSNGDLIYHKGDVIHKSGETVRVTPDEDDMIRYREHVNRFKPYFGIGYETSISKDKRSSIAFDAGICCWGGKPKIDINVPVGVDADGKNTYQTVDLVRDVDNVPGKLGEQVKTAKKYWACPELSVKISHRLW